MEDNYGWTEADYEKAEAIYGLSFNDFRGPGSEFGGYLFAFCRFLR
jgi:hypothetical protein